MNSLTRIKSALTTFSIPGLSIRKQLPLLICILLVIIISLFGAIAYIGIRRTALSVGRERLQSITDELVTLFQQSTQALTTATQAVGNQPEVVHFLVTRNPDSAATALGAMKKLTLDSLTVLVDLQDSSGQGLLSTGKKSIQSKAGLIASLEISTVKPLQALVGKIYTLGDSMYFPVIATISKDKKAIGYIIRWRLLTATPQVIAQWSQLIGTNATIHFGNADGSFWTDVMKPITGPPLNEYKAGEIMNYTRKGEGKVISMAKPLAGTKWLLGIEMSEQTILDPAKRFLYWVIAIGAVLLTVGIVIAWQISRNITGPLNQLMQATSAIAAGDHSSPVTINRQDELGKLAALFNLMSQQVQQARVEILQTNSQLRELSAHLQNIREEERLHIAREIHDELGQQLTGIKMDMVWLKKRISSEDQVVNEKINTTLQLLDQTIQTVRKIATELRPSILDDLGLLESLKWQSQEFSKKTGLPVDFDCETIESTITPDITIGLFRIFQESLTNITRHANANGVMASLRLENDQIILAISDDGKGFDSRSIGHKKTLGLLGMKERMIMMGGTYKIESQPGKGTQVTVIVPLKAHG